MLFKFFRREVQSRLLKAVSQHMHLWVNSWHASQGVEKSGVSENKTRLRVVKLQRLGWAENILMPWGEEKLDFEVESYGQRGLWKLNQAACVLTADGGDSERSWFSTTRSLVGQRRRVWTMFLARQRWSFCCGDLSRKLWNAGTVTSRGFFHGIGCFRLQVPLVNFNSSGLSPFLVNCRWMII